MGLLLQTTHRAETDEFGKRLYTQAVDADRAVVFRVGEIAREHNVSMAQISLAWLLSRPTVTAPIVGATKPQHLDDAVNALKISLTNEEIAALEEPYIPHGVAGFA